MIRITIIAFSVAGPKLWNKLPLDLRSLDTIINLFKKPLKSDSPFLLLLNGFLASGLLTMASRFASISDQEVKEFKQKLENENTKKKTLYDIKVFREDTCDEKREIEDITPVEPQEKKLKITVSDDSSHSQYSLCIYV